jgi:hypothetical protein
MEVEGACQAMPARQQISRNASNIAETLDDRGALLGCNTNLFAGTAEEVSDTAAGDFAPSLGTAEIDRLSYYDLGNHMALGRRVGIHEQGHELFVGSRIGRHDVGLKANERDHFLQIPFRRRALFKGSLDQ